MNDALQYSTAGLKLTEGFETLRLVAYKDGRGIWTVGWGHTGPLVHDGVTVTPDQAQAFLTQDVFGAEVAVKSYVTVPLNQNQFDALVDFTFNEGAEHLKTSTLLLRVNAKAFAEAGEEFLRWVYAAGEIEPGLQTRRAAEKALFLTPIGTEVAVG